MKTTIITVLAIIISFNTFSQSFSKEEIIKKNKKEKHLGIVGLWELTQTTYFIDTSTNTTTEVIVAPDKIYSYFTKVGNEFEKYSYFVDEKCFKRGSSPITMKDGNYFIFIKAHNFLSSIKMISKKEISYEYFYYTGGENEKAKSVITGKRIKRF